MFRHASKATTGLLPAAAVAELGMPALGALVLLAVLVLAVTCWVIGSQERTNRVSQILLARRGTPAAQPAPTAPPAGTSMLKRTLKLVTDREKHRAKLVVGQNAWVVSIIRGGQTSILN